MDPYFRVSLLLVALVHTNYGFRFYQDRIPNGGSVIHPCDSSQMWAGVGHENMQGGGANNQFGKNFKANGFKWTKQLCQEDTDGDGKSNGYELGDPDCTWVKDQEPTRKVNITHPGVCDPVNSAVCKTRNDSTCDHVSKYVCPLIENGSDVRQMTVRLNHTAVPAQETTYICQFVEFPNDDTYDIIGYQPIINNTDVMHHIVFWGCTDDEPREAYTIPRVCGMGIRKCQMFMIGWTLGSVGHCLVKDIGIRIGKNGWKYAIIQNHWNNPQQASHFTDSSGILLHYTPALRKFRESTMLMGVAGFEIPPKKSSHIETATVSEECSQLKQPSTLYIHQVYLHMHYLGKSASLELYRNGRKVQDVAVDRIYSYDRPEFHQIEPVVEYRKGDELKLTCEFDSSKRENVTYMGDATSDEMCYAFISIHPFTREMSNLVWIQNLYETCTAYSPQRGGSPGNMGFIHETRCHVTSYSWGERPKLLARISEFCNSTSLDCSQGCVSYLKQYKSHPCHDEDVPGLLNLVNTYIAPHDYDKEQAKLATLMMKKCSEHLMEKAPPKPEYGPCTASARTVVFNACAMLTLLYASVTENIV